MTLTSRAAPEGARNILESAAALFARDGYEPVSIAQIAQHAGVSKANIFHHYESKEALFMAVMREASNEHAEWAEALLHEEGRSADKLQRLVRYEMENMFAHDQRTRLILREVVDHGTCIGRQVAQQAFHRNFTAVVALFEQGRARGEFRADLDAASAALTFRGALCLYFQCGESLRQFKEARHLDSARDFADRVCDIVLRGVLTESAPSAPAKNGAPKKARP